MNMHNQVWMRAPVSHIYPLAAEVERWPELLPHYRAVTVLERDGNRKLVEMAASRDGFPVSWRALQELDPHTPAIRFRHVRGVTTGMDVEWRFEPRDGGTLVTIAHRLDLRWPLIGRWAAEHVIGPQFIAAIAGKTLRRIKALAEAGTPGAPGAAAGAATSTAAGAGA
jgi:ribosome-associated toxin RatA of RatAB toxin-antitoxin module